MIHPSYVELMDVVNHEVEKTGEDPVVNSRYSIVCATAKRARQIIDGDEPLVRQKSNKPLSIAVDELYDGELKILTEDEVSVGEENKVVYEEKLSRLREAEHKIREIERARQMEQQAARQAALQEAAAAAEQIEDELEDGILSAEEEASEEVSEAFDEDAEEVLSDEAEEALPEEDDPADAEGADE